MNKRRRYIWHALAAIEKRPGMLLAGKASNLVQALPTSNDPWFLTHATILTGNFFSVYKFHTSNNVRIHLCRARLTCVKHYCIAAVSCKKSQTNGTCSAAEPILQSTPLNTKSTGNAKHFKLTEFYIKKNWTCTVRNNEGWGPQKADACTNASINWPATLFTLLTVRCLSWDGVEIRAQQRRGFALENFEFY